MAQDNTQLLKDKIKELLSLMGFEAEVFERVEEGRTVFNIRCSDAQLLIGKQGANLDSLQYILRLILRKDLADDSFSFALDVDDYKENRVIYLKELARRAAHQARETRRSVGMPPMPSYERKVIHDYLSLFSDLASESVGFDPDRRIVIRNKTSADKPKDAFDFIENS